MKVSVKTSGYAMGDMVAVNFDGVWTVGILAKGHRSYQVNDAAGNKIIGWASGAKVLIRTPGNDFPEEVATFNATASTAGQSATPPIPAIGEPEWAAGEHADMDGQHVTILGRNIIAGEWEYEVRDFHGNAHSERSYVTAELLKPWVDGLIDTSVTRYLIRTFGFTAQEASDAVRDFAEIVEKGERMGSRTYFIGDAVAEAWEAARLNRKCPVGSRLYRERDGATGTVTAIEYTGWIRFVLDNGTEYLRTATEVQDMGFEVITAAELAEITGDAEHPVATMRPRSFRKVKDARSARARRGGAR